MRILLIDSSYYNFYRFFATKSWYLRSDERRNAAEGVAWLDNKVFMTTYEKMWFENIKKLRKIFQPNKLIFAKDGDEVWRYKIFKEYKGNRKYDIDDDLMDGPGPTFRYTNAHYHSRVDDSSVVYVPCAEADDIIAMAVSYYLHTISDCEIVIITGDHDLLQLSKPPQVQIYNLKGKKFTNITSSNPYETKMRKILSGDPSDNIKGAFPRCGKITATKLIQDKNLLQEWLDKYGDKQYKLNRLLIDLTYIPEWVKVEIVNELINQR